MTEPTAPARWVATLPKHVEWSDYERELAAVADGCEALNYRVSHPPRDLKPGDRFYIVWRGRVRGWMAVVAVVRHPKGFTCATTGNEFGPGVYIQRTGTFHALERGPLMTGFQGVRRYLGPAD